jgi:ubiquinone/menaquinone biosynthesis C-methylase UbiE
LIRRLNWGCGPIACYGWVNSDIQAWPGVDIVADMRNGLPVDDDAFDYIVSIHALPEIPYGDLDRTLSELRRVLKPGGILRLGLPDMDKAINAYRTGDADYFLISDEEVKCLSGRMIVQLLWRGQSRSMFTTEFAAELLARNGFRAIHPCAFRETGSGISGITELDNRPLESLFIEAAK